MAKQNKIVSIFPSIFGLSKAGLQREIAKVMETVKPQFKTAVVLSLFCFSNLIFALIFSAAFL